MEYQPTCLTKAVFDLVRSKKKAQFKRYQPENIGYSYILIYVRLLVSLRLINVSDYISRCQRLSRISNVQLNSWKSPVYLSNLITLSVEIGSEVVYFCSFDNTVIFIKFSSSSFCVEVQTN